MPKFDDCESCAFYGDEPAICDGCEDADQWEPADELDRDDMMRIRGFSTRIIHIHKYQERKRLERDQKDRERLLGNQETLARKIA